MTCLQLLGIVLALMLPLLAARAAPSDLEWHTAECVAALGVNTAELARQVKDGQEQWRPLLLDRLKSGAAFVGAAYLRGERGEARSKALLRDALEAQKTLPEPVLAARQLACAEEGAGLLAQASFVEREVVALFVQRRLNKLLRPRARRRRRRAPTGRGGRAGPSPSTCGALSC